MAQISFGQCLQQILKDRNCSIVQLQKKLGYKSATTISRILHDTSSVSLAERLLQQLLLTDFLSLSEAESLSLQQALLAGKGSLAQVSAYERLNSLFLSSPVDEDVFFREFMPSGERRYSLSLLLESIQNKSLLLNLSNQEEFTPFEWAESFENIASVQGIIFGSFTLSMVRHFVSLISALPAGSVKVRHFFEVGSDPQRLADLLLSLHSIFLYPWYDAYFNTIEDNSVASAPAFLHHLAVLRFETKQHKVTTYEIRLADSHELYLWKCEGTDAPYASLDAMAASFGELSHYRPARKNLMENNSLDDLITLYRRLYFMERERMWRIIMPTMAMTLVPAEIMLRYAPLFAAEAISANLEIIKPFLELHTARFENIYKKKKPTYMILSKEALRRFASEGWMHDHPYGFPPFTVEERLTIMGAFVKNCRENPYFHVFIAHESFRFGDTSYCCYANLGLSFCQSNTNYHPDSPVQEVAMVIDGILRLFESYFDEELLAKQVDSEAASLAFLEGLLAEIH